MSNIFSRVEIFEDVGFVAVWRRTGMKQLLNIVEKTTSIDVATQWRIGLMEPNSEILTRGKIIK